MNFVSKNSLWSIKKIFLAFSSEIYLLNSSPMNPPAPVINIDLSLNSEKNNSLFIGNSSLPKIYSISIDSSSIFNSPVEILSKPGTQIGLLNLEVFS